MVNSFRDLIVWQKSIELTVLVYQITKSFPKLEQYGLISQVRRAAVSIPSNISEGCARQHTSEFIQFLSIAEGSSAELETQLTIASRLNYINTNDYGVIIEKILEINKMIYTLKKKLSYK